jgi:hypothetical protein
MAKTIKIGHASISENGTINGTAGDSTGKEVYIDPSNNITNNGYHVLLRPKTAALAEKTALACEAGCLNNKIGYSQYGTHGRLTLYNEAKKVNFDLAKVATACNTDCSAFMAVCAIAAGVDVSPSSTTRSMRNNFKNSGSYEVKTDNIYFTSSDYLKRGDILVKEGSHTVMVLANGSKIPKTEPKPAAEIKPEQDTISHLVQDHFALKIALNITNISDTKLSANAKITKIENGKELTLTNVLAYEWTYSLSSLTDSSIKPISERLEIKSDTTTFSISNLHKGRSYLLKVTAKEKNGEAEFSSPNIIFTTTQVQQLFDPSLDTQFIADKNSINKCKLFVKVDKEFKQATIYQI